jgi:hypothetical protein
MRALHIVCLVERILSNYVNILLTMSIFCVHTSPNTPAKPMLFSDSMLKLSGLFFACHILPLKPLVDNQHFPFARLLKGVAA